MKSMAIIQNLKNIITLPVFKDYCVWIKFGVQTIITKFEEKYSLGASHSLFAKYRLTKK